jgi:hypothetical protein
MNYLYLTSRIVILYYPHLPNLFAYCFSFGDVIIYHALGIPGFCTEFTLRPLHLPVEPRLNPFSYAFAPIPNLDKLTFTPSPLTSGWWLTIYHELVHITEHSRLYYRSVAFDENPFFVQAVFNKALTHYDAAGRIGDFEDYVEYAAIEIESVYNRRPAPLSTV